MTITLAVQTDTALAALWTQIYALRGEVAQAVASLGDQTKTEGDYLYKRGYKVFQGDARGWTQILTHAASLAYCPVGATNVFRTGAESRDKYGKMGEGEKDRLLNTLSKYETLRDKMAEIEVETDPLQAIYEQHRWSRFFLVTSSQGHVHSSMSCSTCFPTTEYGWLPNLSGLTEADAVAQEGSILCSVCFPSAPTEWTTGISKAQAEKEAAKCSGSGSRVDASGESLNPYRNNYGSCPDCKAQPAITSTGKLRAHKPA